MKHISWTKSAHYLEQRGPVVAPVAQLRIQCVAGEREARRVVQRLRVVGAAASKRESETTILAKTGPKSKCANMGRLMETWFGSSSLVSHELCLYFGHVLPYDKNQVRLPYGNRVPRFDKAREISGTKCDEPNHVTPLVAPCTHSIGCSRHCFHAFKVI